MISHRSLSCFCAGRFSLSEKNFSFLFLFRAFQIQLNSHVNCDIYVDFEYDQLIRAKEIKRTCAAEQIKKKNDRNNTWCNKHKRFHCLEATIRNKMLFLIKTFKNCCSL